MQAVTTIGLDIAKSVFQVHGIDAVARDKADNRERRGEPEKESLYLRSWASQKFS